MHVKGIMFNLPRHAVLKVVCGRDGPQETMGVELLATQRNFSDGESTQSDDVSGCERTQGKWNSYDDSVCKQRAVGIKIIFFCLLSHSLNKGHSDPWLKHFFANKDR